MVCRGWPKVTLPIPSNSNFYWAPDLLGAHADASLVVKQEASQLTQTFTRLAAGIRQVVDSFFRRT
jgi:hypothetical protein